ncbi:MAG: hypothetical protein AAGK00_12720 [Pseudomonadota bacterium]
MSTMTQLTEAELDRVQGADGMALIISEDAYSATPLAATTAKTKASKHKFTVEREMKES